MDGELSALQLLQEEMQTDEIYLKVNAIHRLKIVICSLSETNFHKHLIPYLESKFVWS